MTSLQEAQPKQPRVQQKAAQGAKKEEAVPAPAPPPEPPLHQAARHGDEDLVTRLLQEGHDPTISVGIVFLAKRGTSTCHGGRQCQHVEANVVALLDCTEGASARLKTLRMTWVPQSRGSAWLLCVSYSWWSVRARESGQTMIISKLGRRASHSSPQSAPRLQARRRMLWPPQRVYETPFAAIWPPLRSSGTGRPPMCPAHSPPKWTSTSRPRRWSPFSHPQLTNLPNSFSNGNLSPAPSPPVSNLIVIGMPDQECLPGMNLQIQDHRDNYLHDFPLHLTTQRS